MIKRKFFDLNHISFHFIGPYLIFHLWITGLMSVTEENEKNTIIITYDLDPRYRNLGIFYIFSFAWNIFLHYPPFKYCLANSDGDRMLYKNYIKIFFSCKCKLRYFMIPIIIIIFDSILLLFRSFILKLMILPVN